MSISLENNINIFKRLHIILLFSVLFVCVFIPVRFYTTVDEHNYLYNSYLIANLKDITSENKFQDYGLFENHQGLKVSKYNLGHSLILSPIQLLNIQNFDLFLIATTLFQILLFYLGLIFFIFSFRLPKWFLILGFLYPLTPFYLRTFLSENSILVILLVIFGLIKYIYDKELNVNAIFYSIFGFISGMLIFIKYTNVFFIIVLTIFLFYEVYKKHDKKIFSKFLLYLFNLGLIFCFILLINKHLYGCFYCSGYSLSGEQAFNISMFFDRLPWLIFYISVGTPILLFIFLYKKSTLFWLTISYLLISLLIHSISGGFLYNSSFFSNLIFGNRFFYPIMFIIYLLTLQSLYDKFNPKFLKLNIIKKIKLSVFFITLGVYTLFSNVHFNFLEDRRHIYKTIQSLSSEKILFVGTEEDFIYFGPQMKHDSIFYTDLNNLQKYQKDDLKRFDKILVMLPSYNSRNDRPTQQVQSYVKKNNLKKYLSSNHLDLFYLNL